MEKKRPPIVQIEVRVKRLDESERSYTTPRLVVIQPLAPSIQSPGSSPSMERLAAMPITEEVNKCISGLTTLSAELQSYLDKG